MKEFPKLKNEQVALLQADFNTGHVLDVDFNLCINDSQEIYTVFESYEAALKKIKILFQQKENIEFVIYNSTQEIIKHLSSEADI